MITLTLKEIPVVPLEAESISPDVMADLKADAIAALPVFLGKRQLQMRGIIAIKAKARDFAGLKMKGGTLILGGGAEIRAGAWMIRGTIISLGPLQLLPTFLFDCEYHPTFVTLYAKKLESLGFPIPYAPS